MSSVNTRKQVIFRLLALLMPLLAGELALRAFDLVRGRSVRARANWYWAFEQDRFLSYRHRPRVDITLSSGVHMDSNSAGFRDVEIPIESPEPRRLVICIGESSTWGFRARDRLSTWPKKVQGLLRKTDDRFVVMNAALPGYTLVENLQLTQLRLLKFKPEAIVCMGLRNDFRAYAGCLGADIDFNHYRRIFAELPKTRWNDLWMRSSLLAALATPLRPYFEAGAFYPQAYRSKCTARGETLFRDQVALLNTLCRRHGVKLLWVDQPIDYRDKEGGLLRPGFEHLRRVLHDELEKQEIPLLDAHAVYDYAQFPLADDVHHTPEGINHLASLLAPQILEQLKR